MTKSLPQPLVSYGLVILQFVGIGLLVITGPWFASALGVSWQIAGILTGIWAVQTMHLGRFNIIPDPKPDSLLIQAGPYRLIRHPMYLSILLFFIPLVVESVTPLRIVVLISLILTLLFKLQYEEKLLSKRFDDYADYQQRSKKLIPFVF